jgi:hypothetical protein
MAAVSEPDAPIAPAPTPPPKPSHRTRTLAVILLVVIIVVAVVCLYTIPISTSYSETLSATASTNGVATFSPPSGAQVHGTWSTTDGDSVTLKILASDGNTAYSADSSSGSFSFMASSPPYMFEAVTTLFSHTVDVSGHYTAPYL